MTCSPELKGRPVRGRRIFEAETLSSSVLGRSQGDSLQLRRHISPHTLPHSLCQRAMLKKLNKKEAKAIVDRLTVPSCPSLKKEHVQEATEVLGRVLVRAAKQRSTLRSSTAHSRAARQHQTARGASSARSTPRGAPRRGAPASALTSSSSSSSLRCLLSHAGVPR